MNKYIIYKDIKDKTYAYEIPEGYTEAEISNALSKQGYTIVRSTGIVGKDQADAIARLKKASELRTEADIIKNRPPVVEEPKPTKIQQNVREVAGEPIRVMTNLPKLAKDIYSRYVVGDENIKPLDTYLTTVATPFKSELANEILGDPSLIPSLFIPGFGQAKAGKYIPEMSKYLLRRGGEGAIQNVASDIAGGRIEDIGDIASSANIGAIGGAVGSGAMELAGKGIKAGGKKILQGRWKGEGKDIEKAMGAVSPSGGKTIKAFRSDEEISDAVIKDLKTYEGLQGKSLEDIDVNDVEDALSNLATKYDVELQMKKITPEVYDKKIGVLQSEYGRFVGKPVKSENLPWTPRQNEEMPPLISLSSYPASEVHNAKVNVGNLARYDIKNQAETSSKTMRDVYDDVYKEYNRVITEAEQANTQLPDDVKAQYNKLINGAFNALNAGDNRTYGRLASEATDLLNESLAKNPSKYQKYTKAMAPLMTAKDLVEPAIVRTDKNVPLSLSMLLAGSGTYAGSQSIPGAIAASTIPVMLQGTRMGTGLYRTGEELGKSGRYMIPLGIRTLPETED